MYAFFFPFNFRSSDLTCIHASNSAKDVYSCTVKPYKMQIVSLKEKRSQIYQTTEDATEVKSLVIFHLKVMNIKSKTLELKMTRDIS